MSLYKILLSFYPAAFRADYQDELCSIFVQKRRDASGVFAVLIFWVQETWDVLHNAARIHWDMFQRDLGYTVRTAFRSPGFALTAILMTALGIGANTAVFSVVNHVLIRPLPYSDPERIIRIWEKDPQYARTEASPPNYKDWRQRSKSFERMGAYTSTSMNLVGRGLPERVDGALVTTDLLPLLGVTPVMGRLFTAEEEMKGSAQAVLLSFGLWQSKYNSSGSVLGQSIRLNDGLYTVIGVLPAWFTFPVRETRFWIPFQWNAESGDEDRDNNYLKVIGKLRPNVSLEQARAELNVIATKLEQEYPVENEKVGTTVERLQDSVPEQSRLLLAALLGASICVLLIACTNLANLFLVRAMERRKELIIRAALGAGRERLARQLLTESMMFALTGALLGLIIANASVPLLSRLIPTSLPVGQATIMDIRVLGFAALLLSITTVAFGVIPSMRICSAADAASLREGTRSTIGDRKEHVRSALVIAEVTASVILLVSSGLLIRAMWKIQGTDPGFRTENVLTLQTPLPLPKYENTARRVDFYSRVLSNVRALPDVSNAAYISFLPMVMRGGIWPILKEGGIRPAVEDSHNASLRFVSPGFFEALKIPVKQGRDVAESDTMDSPFVAVVSESFVRHYWPNPRENPIGRRLHVAFHDRTIIGVVGDIRVRGLEQDSEPQLYLPYTQVRDGNLQFYIPHSLVIRTHGGEASRSFDAVRTIIQKADPEMPVTDVQPLQDVVEEETASRATQIRVIGAFTLLSLLLAGIGIHGLLSFTVSQRIPEIGLRIALGATSNDILRIVLSRGFQVAAIGASVGIILAYASARAMQALLAGIDPGDASTFVSATLVALLMTLSGCLLPSWRALRVDPATVMRGE